MNHEIFYHAAVRVQGSWVMFACWEKADHYPRQTGGNKLLKFEIAYWGTCDTSFVDILFFRILVEENKLDDYAVGHQPA